MDTEDTRARLARSRRMRIALRIGVTAVLLAVVIVVVGALTTAKPSGPTPGDLPRIVAPAGQQDYNAGLAALAAGDTTQAVALLKRAAAAGNGAARAKLDEIAKAGGTSTTTPSPPATPTPDAYGSKVADLASLLPAGVAGYTSQLVETSTASAILPLQPDKTGPITTVSLVVVTVFDRGTVSSAKAYVAGFPRAYPKDPQTVKVGVQSARFGTDGSHLAAVAFSRGRYAFEVVVTSSKGVPASLKDTVVKVATALPAAH
jgi:hypothetical protein